MVTFIFLVKQAIWLFFLTLGLIHCLAEGRKESVPELKRVGYGFLVVLCAAASLAMVVLMLHTVFLGVPVFNL